MDLEGRTGPVAKMLVIVAMFVLAMALGVGTAFAATISNQVPVNGSTVTSPATVSVDINDTMTFSAATAAPTVKLDGNALAATLTGSGANVTVSAAVPGTLSAGAHTVVATAKNMRAATDTSTWTFTVGDMALPTVSIVSPVNGTIVDTLSPVVSAQVTEATDVTFTFDGGAPVLGVVDGTGLAVPSVAPTFADGSTHVVVVTATNEGGSASAASSFKVSRATPMTGDCLICHSTAAAAAAPNHTSTSTNCGGTDCHSSDVTITHKSLGCAVCHSSSDPVVQGAIATKDTSCTTCHDNPHPADSSDSQAVCLSCHSHINSETFAMSVHAGVTGPGATDASCVGCHDYHSPSSTIYAAKGAPAANSTALCYGCHGKGAAAGMDVQTPSTLGGTPTPTVASHIFNPGAHSARETLADLATNRHAACEDCHAPHEAQLGLHIPSGIDGTGALAAPVLYGATNVTIDYSTDASSNWAAPSAADYKMGKVTSTSTEASLCLKCHAGPGEPATGEASGLKTSGTSTIYYRSDLGQEFNPNNASGHNVGQGGMKSAPIYTDSTGVVRSDTWQIPTTAWISGVTTPADGIITDAQITCTDCHTGGSTATAVGPHGSTQQWMLDPNYPVDWTGVTCSQMSSGTNYNQCLCAKCHPGAATVSAVSNVHGGNHTSYMCGQCHIAVPHGWKRPRLLLNANVDSAPYRTPGSPGGLTFVLAKAHTGSWSQSDCGQVGCGTHSATTTSPYIP